MKKLLLSLIAIATLSVSAYSQNASVVDVEGLTTKLEKAEATAKHPKKGLKAAAWLKYAQALSDVYYANIKTIYIGADASGIVTTMGNPGNAKNIPIKEINGKQYKLYTYPRVHIYFDMNDKLALYQDKKPIRENSLDEWAEAAIKAAELDPKETENVKKMLETIVNSYLLNMQNSLSLKGYKEAVKWAEKAAVLQQHELLKDPKYAESYYYASACCMQGSMFNLAKKYLNILMKAQEFRGGEVHYYLAFAEDQLGNTDAAKKVYEEGLVKFTENEDILKGLIDIYMKTGEDPSKVIPYIKQAQEKDNNNVALYIFEGVAYEKMGQIDKSIEAYKKAIEVDGKSFIAYYNIGYSYSLLADELVKEVNSVDVSDQTLYQQKLAQLNEMRAQAVPYLVQAHELDKTEPNTISLLRSLFFAIRNVKPEYMEGYNKFDALYQAQK